MCCDMLQEITSTLSSWWSQSYYTNRSGMSKRTVLGMALHIWCSFPSGLSEKISSSELCLESDFDTYNGKLILHSIWSASNVTVNSTVRKFHLAQQKHLKCNQHCIVSLHSMEIKSRQYANPTLNPAHRQHSKGELHQQNTYVSHIETGLQV